MIESENKRFNSLLLITLALAIPLHIFFNDTANNPVFEYVPANVIENTTHKQSNYIILDKGGKDSIAIDMGVITARGIVGIVKDGFTLIFV